MTDPEFFPSRRWRDRRLAPPAGRVVPALHRTKIVRQYSVYLYVIAITLVASSLQGQNPRGSLVGKVVDSTGARIADAAVILTQSATSFKRQTVASREGDFEIQSLLPGRYQVRASAAGFAEAETEVDVNVSAKASISLTLRPGQRKQSVDDKGQTPLTIETTSSE